MSDSILTAEQMHAWLHDGHEDTLTADDMVYRSHEALRARAERYQDERDAALALLNHAQGNELLALEQVGELTDALKRERTRAIEVDEAYRAWQRANEAPTVYSENP